jgi:hypothetical protein
MSRYLSGKLRRRSLPDEEIVRLYCGDGMSSYDIGLMADCSYNTVLKLVRKAGGTVRKRGGEPGVAPRAYRR